MTRALALGLLLATIAGTFAGEPPLPEVADALARIKDRSTIALTTTGRRSGKPHTRTIWFVVSDGTMVVQAGKQGKTDWYRNLLATPTAIVREDRYEFRVRAKSITESARVEAIHQLFLKKYTSAWLLSFLGSSIGRGLPVELEPVAVAVRRESPPEHS